MNSACLIARSHQRSMLMEGGSGRKVLLSLPIFVHRLDDDLPTSVGYRMKFVNRTLDDEELEPALAELMVGELAV